MLQPTKVAIIGAGIAGLSCATALQSAGFNVTVFEKSRGPSGRLSTRVTDDWQCDHGAQYFTARDALFDAEVNRWIQAGVASLWQPKLQIYDGNSFATKHSDHASETLRYVGYPRNNAPAKWLASSLNLQTESTVIGIHQQAHQWQIMTKEHGFYAEYFDVIVLALPAPQAAALLTNIASSAAQVGASVVMQPCFALMVQLSKTIPCAFDGLFINTGPLSWIARDSAKPGRFNQNSNTETWVLHATSLWSKAHIDDDKEEVAQLMLAEFANIIQRANALAPSIDLQRHQLHRWLYADCEQYLNSVYHYDKANKIAMCGDWLNGGKVQGAWLSGLKLAQHLLAENNHP